MNLTAFESRFQRTCCRRSESPDIGAASGSTIVSRRTPFASAAGSNLAYLDGLTQSSPLGDPDYGLARFAGSVGERRGATAKLKEDWGEDSMAWGLFSLAASELSYFRTSVLISKWYSLGARTDWAGRARSVEHTKAFAHMLTFAEARARLFPGADSSRRSDPWLRRKLRAAGHFRSGWSGRV